MYHGSCPCKILTVNTHTHIYIWRVLQGNGGPDATVACGGLAYSPDGVSWHYADPAGTAYTPLVQWADEATGEATGEYHFTRRERPHLIFDKSGAMVGLTNGVEYSWAGQAREDSMHDATYTLLQPIRSSA